MKNGLTLLLLTLISSTIGSKVGFEIELLSRVQVQRFNDLDFQPSAKDDIFRVNDNWCLRTDYFSTDVHTFEYITRPFESDNSEKTASLRTMKSILASMNKLYESYWNMNRNLVQSPVGPSWAQTTWRNLIAGNANYFPKAYANIANHLEDCLADLPYQNGIDTQKTVMWQPRRDHGSFTVDQLVYSVPYANSFVQVTVDVHPSRMFTFVKRLAEVEGLGFSSYTTKSFIQVADQSFKRMEVTDPYAQSFLYLVMSYISSAQFCNLPYQGAHTWWAYQKLLMHGDHPALFDFGKRFTDINGILSRTDFADMFQSLPVGTQEYLRANMEFLLSDLLRDCGGSRVLSSTLFKYGFYKFEEDTSKIPLHHKWIAATSSNIPKTVLRGPIIRDWIRGFMEEGKDLLTGGEFESMGQMKVTPNGEWILELRRGPADTIGVPVRTEDGTFRSVTYGFANAYAFLDVVHFLNTENIDQLESLGAEDMNRIWDEAVMKAGAELGITTEFYVKLLEEQVGKCITITPNLEPLIRLWLMRHL